MKSWKWAIAWGLAIWLVPFVISIPFYSQAGQLLIDEHYFKTLMVVVGAAMGGVATVMYFRNVDSNFLKQGAAVGLLWLLMNWALDLIILLPLMHLDIPAYLGQIGLRYLSVMIMTLTAGAVLEAQCERQRLPAKKGRK